MIEIKLCFFVILVDFLMLVICNNGLEGVLINNIFVVGCIVCIIEFVFVVFIKFILMLNCVNIFVNVW